MGDLPEDNVFWQFSLQYYDAPGVEASCLRYQEKYHANVNLILFCCWLGEQSILLDKKTFVELEALVADWQQQIVKPLREIRIALKQPEFARSSELSLQQCKTALLNAELTAEKIVQNMLFNWWRDQNFSATTNLQQAEVKRLNLNGYLAGLNCPAVESDNPLLTAVKNFEETDREL